MRWLLLMKRAFLFFSVGCEILDGNQEWKQLQYKRRFTKFSTEIKIVKMKIPIFDAQFKENPPIQLFIESGRSSKPSRLSPRSESYMDFPSIHFIFLTNW